MGTKRKGFYILRNTQIAASVQPDGRGTQFIYLSDGRIESSAKITGNITDEEMLALLKTAEGLRKLVHSIGVTVETDSGEEQVNFAFQIYGKTFISYVQFSYAYHAHCLCLINLEKSCPRLAKSFLP